MIDKSFVLNVVAQIARRDPKGNGLKAGFDIDMQGVIPETFKDMFSSLLLRREWSPIEGIRIHSNKPICPVYQGTTFADRVHFLFPAPITLNVTNMFLVRHLNITIVEMYVGADLSSLDLVVKTWPDIHIKL